MSQPAFKQEAVPYDFTCSFIPSFFNTGMYLVEVEKVKLNTRLEPVMTFKVLDSFDGKMVNARRTENFFVKSPKASALWREKMTEVMNALGLMTITDLTELVAKPLVMSIYQAGRETLPSFRKATDFDKTWQPKAVRLVTQSAKRPL